MPIRRDMDDLRGHDAGGGWREAERGAILVEYGMVLVAVLLVSFALVQAIGSRVVEMFRGVLPGFGG